jgi:hypothetical protein
MKRRTIVYLVSCIYLVAFYSIYRFNWINGSFSPVLVKPATSEQDSLCNDAKAMVVVSDISSSVSRLYTISKLILAIQPVQALHQGLNSIMVHICSEMVHPVYNISDLRLRGRLVGNNDVIPLNFSLNADLKAITVMGFIASNGTYKLYIHPWYLGESRWDVNVTLYKNSTMPDPYVYFPVQLDSHEFNLNNAIYNSNQLISTDFEVTGKDSAFCDSIDSLQNGRWRVFYHEGNDCSLHDNNCFGNLSTLEDADNINGKHYWFLLLT